MSGRERALAGCNIFLLGTQQKDKDWTPQSISTGVSNLSGRVASQFDESVTHVVVHERYWKMLHDPQGNKTAQQVQQALQLKKAGRDLKIVNYDWLEDSIHSSSKKHEDAYLWDKHEEAERAGGRPGGSANQMRILLEESTAPFVDQGEKKKMLSQQAKQQELTEQQEDAEKPEKQKEKEQAMNARKGVRKLRNETFADEHRIYVNKTGFKYEVLLTRIDSAHNRNQRWALTLQIYESNESPATYAVNAQYGPTKSPPQNQVVGVTSSNFPTALRLFKKEFKQYTGVDWDRRISAHVARQGGADGEGAGSGESGSGAFVYHPPVYGSAGELTEAENQIWKALRDAGISYGAGAAKEKTSAGPAAGGLAQDASSDSKGSDEETTEKSATADQQRLPSTPSGAVPRRDQEAYLANSSSSDWDDDRRNTHEGLASVEEETDVFWDHAGYGGSLKYPDAGNTMEFDSGGNEPQVDEVVQDVKPPAGVVSTGANKHGNNASLNLVKSILGKRKDGLLENAVTDKTMGGNSPAGHEAAKKAKLIHPAHDGFEAESGVLAGEKTSALNGALLGGEDVAEEDTR